jgi:opacity protein-like surface antigen
MKKAIIIFAMVVLSTGLVKGQELSTTYSLSSYYTFSWNFTFPMGDFSKWVDKTSIAGFDFGGRYLIMNGLTTGFNVAWQRVDNIYENETYYFPDKGMAITATNYRETWMVPFQAVIGYHLNPDKMISPYATLGIGGDYMEHHVMIQEYDIYQTQWDFSLTPEIGVLAKFGKFSNWAGLVAFNYKWTTNKVDLIDDKSGNLSMLNLKIGLAYCIN